MSMQLGDGGGHVSMGRIYDFSPVLMSRECQLPWGMVQEGPIPAGRDYFHSLHVNNFLCVHYTQSANQFLPPLLVAQTGGSSPSASNERTGIPMFHFQ